MSTVVDCWISDEPVVIDLLLVRQRQSDIGNKTTREEKSLNRTRFAILERAAEPR